MSDTEKIKASFTLAAETIRKLKITPTDDELLTLYAFYKQSTVGNCNIEKPGILDPKGRRKWDAWKKLKGVDKYDAMEKYFNHAMNLINKYVMNS